MKRPVVIVCLVLASLLSSPVTQAEAPDIEIAIVEDREPAEWGFSPATITVPSGTTLTWRNTGLGAHSVTSRDQLFDSLLLDPGDTWSYTFDTPGTYRYFCVPYPWMKGVVVVTPSEALSPNSTVDEEIGPRLTPTPTSSDEFAPRPSPTPSPTPISSS